MSKDEPTPRPRGIFGHEADEAKVILEHMPAIAFVKDRGGRYLFVNRLFETHLGVTAEHALGKTDHEMFPVVIADGFVAHDQSVLRTKQPLMEEEVALHGDGKWHTTIAVKFPLLDTAGEPYALCGVATDITDRKEAEQKVKRSEAQLSEAQRLAHLGSWEWDMRANTVTWSAELYRIHGLDPAQFLATFDGFLDRVVPGDRERVRSVVGQARRDKVPFEIEYGITRPDGSSRALRARGQVLSDGAGEPVLMTGTAQDVTERKALEDELVARSRKLEEINVSLERRTAELAEKNQEVEAFVYIVSHDLRAPLVNLQGFARELELCCQDLQGRLRSVTLPEGIRQEVDGILNDGMLSALRYISASTTKFQRLIDALLMLSRLGRQEYRLEEVDMNALVDTTLDSVRQGIDTSGVRVTRDPLPNAKGDTTALGQILSNLIGNALKYRQPGRAGIVTLGGEAWQAGPHLNHYWVRDNGAGIPAAAQPRLFQVFQRFHPALASGEGMGLAIVKRIVDRHGGTIWADSEQNAGTTFHFTLPAGRPVAGGIP